jgi:hypothetical protein
MFPIRDNIPSRTTPFINYLLIGLCVIVFAAQLRGDGRTVERYGMIPARVLEPGRAIRIEFEERVRTPAGIRLRQVSHLAAAPAVPPLLTLLTCIFLHGGWLHLLGNVWFLYIFGDNVEDRFGHLGYLVFYLGCGIAASLAHMIANAGSAVPTIGASGAVAGVMGAYFLLYPRARVLTVIPIFFFLYMFVVPAPVFLGIWFLIQFVQGTVGAGAATGVAWWAHIGGFLAGVVVVLLAGRTRRLRPKVETVRPDTDRVRAYRIGGGRRPRR